IQNNIFYQPGQNVGISGTTSSAHIDHNLSTGTVGGGGIGSNIENTDPQFVNPSALDFRLQAGSPAIDAGVTLSYVSSDVLGVSRPQGAGPSGPATRSGCGAGPIPAGSTRPSPARAPRRSSCANTQASGPRSTAISTCTARTRSTGGSRSLNRARRPTPTTRSRPTGPIASSSTSS